MSDMTGGNGTRDIADPVAISVRGLVKNYDEVEAVRGVEFEVATGEVFGFLGPNGAGKTTTINMLCTLVKPTAGSASVAGHDVVRERDDVRRNIGLVFQDPTLDGYLTAEQNLRLHAELYGVQSELVKPRMEQVMTMVGLWDRKDSVVGTFSGGMRRRLEIARGLMHSPRVLFLDEPTIGLDPQTRRSIWEYIARAQGARGDHDLHDHSLHGRGGVVRPDRDHGPRRDRRARRSRDAQGRGRHRPRHDPHRRRRGRRSPRSRSASESKRGSPKAP